MDVTQRYTVQNWTRNVFPKPFGAWGDTTRGLSTFEYFDLTGAKAAADSSAAGCVIGFEATFRDAHFLSSVGKQSVNATKRYGSAELCAQSLR